MMYQSGEHGTTMYRLTFSKRNEIGELQQKLSKTGCLEELQKLAELLARCNGQPDPMWIKGPNNLDRREVPVNDDCFIVIRNAT
jgi:hypothetical protein